MSTVTAPQYGRGTSALQEARARRENTQEEIAQKKRETEKVQQALTVARRERIKRYEGAVQLVAKLLTEEQYRVAQQAALDEIRHMLYALRSLSDTNDRVWVAKKILHLTSWRGMKAFNDVEQALIAAFNENIPDEIAEGLARLIDKQTEFLRKNSINTRKVGGVVRSGKTAKDRKSGALRQHEQNRARKAAENRERAHSGNSGGDKGDKQKKKK